jgi:uncharacterized membrane protein YccC
MSVPSNGGSEPEPQQTRSVSVDAVAAHSSIIRAIAFVARCSGAATCAYVAAVEIGLPHAVWAAISALIVSQERLDDTTTSLTGRIAGTIIGACIAVAVSVAAARLATGVALQVAVAVALCATIARERPRLRVCMWTAPYCAADNRAGRADLNRGDLSRQRGHSRRPDWRCVSLGS